MSQITLPSGIQDWIDAQSKWCREKNKNIQGNWRCRPPGKHRYKRGTGGSFTTIYKGREHRGCYIRCGQCGKYAIYDCDI